MAMTLLEAGKSQEGRQRAFVEVYANSYQPLQVSPIVSAPTGKREWSISQNLGTTSSTRQVNADFTADSGQVENYSASAKIYGGKIEVDTYIVEHYPERVVSEKKRKINKLARDLTVDTFEGQGGASLKGVREYCYTNYTNQAVSMGSTSGGDVITMDKMDELLDVVNLVPGSTYLYMNQKPFNALSKIARAGTAQALRFEMNQFGVRVPFYANVPIVVMKDSKGEDILSTVEAEDSAQGTFTGGSATSVYCVTWGEDMCEHFAKSPTPKVTEVKDASNFDDYRAEWFPGFAQVTPRAAGRLYNVKNAVA